MSQYVTYTSHKKKKTAFWLCLCGGFLGLHYFYVGRNFKGLLYMFTFGFCMLGWLSDIAVIAGGNFRDNGGAALRE